MRRLGRIIVIILVFTYILTIGAGSCRSSQQPNVAEDPNMVAVIGPYEITGEQFKQEYTRRLMPNPYTAMPPRPAPDFNDVIMQMLGDKAIILDARAKGMHKREEIVSFMRSTRQQRLANMVAQRVIGKDIPVSEKDINDVLANRPGLNREQAIAMARRQKAMQMLDAHYKELIKGLSLQKSKENIAKVAQFHHRLITKPKPPEKKNIFWIENSQLKTDLDPNERALVLASFNGGQFTVEDWFLALFEMAPPRRPKDLSTPEGAERFLDMALERPMFAAEAVAKGLDKDQQLNRELGRLEDDWVFGFAQQELMKGLTEPNEQEITTFYQQVKDRYARNDLLKLAIIWCKDRDAAQKVRQELDQGRPFELLLQRYSSDQKVSEPVDAYARTEGPFWADLWKAEPNQVVGPILGFRQGQLAWRLIKVLAKVPAESPAFENIEGMLKEDLAEIKRQQLLDLKRKELLSGYTYKVFWDRLSAFDPRNLP